MAGSGLSSPPLRVDSGRKGPPRSPYFAIVPVFSPLRTFPVLMLAAAAAVLLSTCAPTPVDRSMSPQMLPVDQALTDLLPIGPHRLELTQTVSGGGRVATVTAQGSIDLGVDAFAADCTMDLVFVYESRRGTATYEVQRFLGQDAQHRLLDVRVPQPSGDPFPTGRYQPRTWYAGVSADVPAPPLLFAPTLLSEGAPVSPDGPGSYCTWRLMDRAATIAPDGTLTWVPESVSALLAAGFKTYVTGALGPAAHERMVRAGLQPDWSAVGSVMSMSMSVVKDPATGTITLRQESASGGTLIIATLTPVSSLKR